MNNRALAEIPLFVFVGALTGLFTAILFSLDPSSTATNVWMVGWMVGPWIVFNILLQLDWYRKHGEWI